MMVVGERCEVTSPSPPNPPSVPGTQGRDMKCLTDESNIPRHTANESNLISEQARLEQRHNFVHFVPLGSPTERSRREEQYPSHIGGRAPELRCAHTTAPRYR